jgi:hypothetical protein
MATDNHNRNPTFLDDIGPPVEIQPRLTGIHQTGRVVIIDNPISYVVEPGRYYPFLSLRGHGDPISQDLTNRMILGDAVGEEMPSNREPIHVTPGFERTLPSVSTRGAAQFSRARLSNTTLTGTGPETLPPPDLPEGQDFFTGIPHDARTRF